MHQYLFHIGDFPIRMYGLMLTLAIFLATGTAYFLARQDGRWHEHVLDIGIYGGFAGLIGLLEIPFVWQGGMAVQGGLLAGLVTGIIYCKLHKIDWLALADIVCPAMILGQAVGRMANLLNGDAFGAPTGGDFGIIYPEGTLARATYGTQPLWPAEVWEGQLDVVIFALLLVFRAFPHAKGQALCLYGFLYSLERFCLEFLRGDYAEPWLFGLTSAQATSSGFMLVCLGFFLYFGYLTKQDPERVMLPGSAVGRTGGEAGKTAGLSAEDEKRKQGKNAKKR